MHGHLTREIKALMLNFLKTEFIHERRESNQEAHNLARSAILDSFGQRVWLICLPDGVCTQYSLID